MENTPEAHVHVELAEPQGQETTLIWASAARSAVCSRGTRTRPGMGGRPFSPPASPGHWDMLRGPPNGKQAPLPISSPQIPGKPASAEQGQRGTPLSPCHERVFSLNSSEALCNSECLISTLDNRNKSREWPADKGPQKAQGPSLGPAIGGGTAAEKGSPSPLPVCRLPSSWAAGATARLSRAS